MSALRIIAYSAFVLLLGLSACRKDMLQFRNVVQLSSGTSQRLNNIKFLSDSVCLAAGGETFYTSVICRSIDGGFTWSADTSQDAHKELYGLGVASGGRVYLSGIDGSLLLSSDYGASWTFQRIGNWLTYKGGTFPVVDTGLFVSTILQRDAALTRLDANYNIIDSREFAFGINGLYMLSQRTGYIIGYGAVMRTRDLGNSWEFLDVDGDNFTAMAILGNDMWICGANGSIFHSTNNGDNWARQRNGNDLAAKRYMLRAIMFTDEMNGWAAGEYGAVIFTRDGGEHWSEYKAFTTATIRSIDAAPNGDLLFAGDDGNIFRVTP